MRNEIEKVLEAMREDYKRWNRNGRHIEMERDFCEGLEVTEGSRYWKIISNDRGGGRSVKGFVAKAGDKKFREGDLLKPAGWAAPARNFARGNVLDGTGVTNTRWTGIG